jgi:hypothetical protein
VLCFGVKQAVAIFSALARQPCRWWRSRGQLLISYIDDVAAVSPTEEECAAARDMVIKDCRDLNIQVNFEKSMLTPSQVFLFTGVIVDLKQGRFFVPESKLVDLEQRLAEVKANPGFETCRSLAGVAGKILSMSMALQPARLLTRGLYGALKCKSPEDWERLVQWIPRATEEIVWWCENLRPWCDVGALIWPDKRPIQLRIVGDAGPDGYGARIDSRVLPGGSFSVAEVEVFGAYAPDEAGLAQAHRELLGLLKVVRGLERVEKALVQGRRILYCTDCVAARSYVERGGGPSEAMTAITLEVWACAVRCQFSLTCAWIPGTSMVTEGVDALSRSAIRTETWSILPAVRTQLAEWAAAGSGWIDTSAVHTRQAFESLWAVDGAILFPGCHRVREVLDFAQSSPGPLGLLLPRWLSVSWWPVVVRFSTRVYELGRADRVFSRPSASELPLWNFVFAVFEPGWSGRPRRPLGEYPPGFNAGGRGGRGARWRAAAVSADVSGDPKARGKRRRYGRVPVQPAAADEGGGGGGGAGDRRGRHQGRRRGAPSGASAQ